MRIRSLAIMAAFALVASNVFAGTVNVIPSVVARYDAGFNPLPFASPDTGPITDGAGIYQIDLSMQSFPSEGELGFASLAFDVDLAASMSVALEYQSDPTQVDSNGTFPGGVVAKWTTNQDAGAPGDYLGMLLAGPGNLSATCGGANCPDPRGRLGDPAPDYFGSLFVQVNEAGGPLGFSNFQFSMRDASTGAFLAPQDGQIAPILFNFGTVADPPVVEDFLHPQMDGSADANPMPIMHTFTQLGGTDPIVWDGFMLDSYTPNYSGVGTGPLVDATFDPETQKFTWNPIGSPRGDYVWKVTASNSAGEDTGFLTVQIKNVPEPTTLGLIGLGLIGLVGIARRRS